MTSTNSAPRIWLTETGTVCLRETHTRYVGDWDDDWSNLQAETTETVREFWVPLNGSYVREISDRFPGTTGTQVCGRLRHQGNTLNTSRDKLLDVIRREYRRAISKPNEKY